MTKQQIKNELKEGLKQAYKKGYTAESVEKALEDLSTNLSNQFETYFDARREEINQNEGSVDVSLRNLFGRLIDELSKQSIVMGTNLNKEILNNIKTELDE